MQYLYEVVVIDCSKWTGKSKEDYLKVVQKRGLEGWRFVGFAPTLATPKGSHTDLELVFEKQVAAE